jgi:hypothetical protein
MSSGSKSVDAVKIQTRLDGTSGLRGCVMGCVPEEAVFLNLSI